MAKVQVWRATMASIDRTAVHLVPGPQPEPMPGYSLHHVSIEPLCGRKMWARPVVPGKTRTSGSCVRCQRRLEALLEEES